MSNDEIIELELSLLLIKYGESKIINCLARLKALSDEELENKLQKVRRIKRKPSKSGRNTKSNAIEKLINEYPEKSNILNLLYSRFQNKSFLPHLSDIKRLFNRYSIESESLKSRSTSTPKIFNLLVNLNEKELEELAQELDKTNFSSLGIISDEIMKR